MSKFFRNIQNLSICYYRIVKTKIIFLIKKTKMQIQIYSLNSELNKLYTVLGKAVYIVNKNHEVASLSYDSELNAVEQKVLVLANLKHVQAAMEQERLQIVSNCLTKAKNNNIFRQTNTCPNCQTKFKNSVNFCTRCGYKLK